jgi:AraC-like DNA-binding protein
MVEYTTNVTDAALAEAEQLAACRRSETPFRYGMYRTFLCSGDGASAGKPHWHDAFEFLLAAGIDATLIAAGKQYPVADYRLFVLKPRTVHGIRYQGRGESRIWSFQIRADSVRSMSGFEPNGLYEALMKVPVAPPFNGRPVARMIEELAKTGAVPRDPVLRISQQALALRTVLSIITAVLPGAARPEPRPVHDCSQNAREMLAIIETLALEGADTGAMAKRIGVSREHFSRTFRALCGRSPKDFANELRIEHAQKLLFEGKPVKTIASETGFRDSSHFVSVFKKTVGQPPKKWARARKDALKAQTAGA